MFWTKGDQNIWTKYIRTWWQRVHQNLANQNLHQPDSYFRFCFVRISHQNLHHQIFIPSDFGSAEFASHQNMHVQILHHQIVCPSELGSSKLTAFNLMSAECALPDFSFHQNLTHLDVTPPDFARPEFALSDLYVARLCHNRNLQYQHMCDQSHVGSDWARSSQKHVVWILKALQNLPCMRVSRLRNILKYSAV